VGNLSIESQVAELCRDALAAMANDCNHNVWAACERLRTDLKSIVSETRHTVIDRGVEALRNSVLWANAYSADDAVRSMVSYVASDELERSVCGSETIDPIFALLAFTESDSTTYKYKSTNPVPSFSFKKIND